jgi:hypothetical protein
MIHPRCQQKENNMLDIRIPIGLLFALLGVILVIVGAVSDPEVYRIHSGTTNINLIWGAVMLVFGGIMLLLARWRRE